MKIEIKAIRPFGVGGGQQAEPGRSYVIPRGAAEAAVRRGDAEWGRLSPSQRKVLFPPSQPAPRNRPVHSIGGPNITESPRRPGAPPSATEGSVRDTPSEPGTATSTSEDAGEVTPEAQAVAGLRELDAEARAEVLDGKNRSELWALLGAADPDHGLKWAGSSAEDLRGALDRHFGDSSSEG